MEIDTQKVARLRQIRTEFNDFMFRLGQEFPLFRPTDLVHLACALMGDDVVNTVKILGDVPRSPARSPAKKLTPPPPVEEEEDTSGEEAEEDTPEGEEEGRFISNPRLREVYRFLLPFPEGLHLDEILPSVKHLFSTSKSPRTALYNMLYSNKEYIHALGRSRFRALP